ncbi:MAG: alpha/beta hydrolase [Sphingobacteriia bacterium]|nr:MAG: alpha/beta hydrolase [Sphingobacteriia bacterium]TAG31931.1 MAG: alpha/beta hydrolase [Sphingobacteriia bacterium]TAH07892.1 MAG: alpha/beta hydrolase [Sphingobacteriia bacterium]
MKMNLWLRIMIGYYKQKLQIVGMFSTRKAAMMAFDLFCTPFTNTTQKRVPTIFQQSDPTSFKLYDLTIRGFHWKSNLPNSKKVLIVHGFSSYAYKFEGFIAPLKELGFEVFAFDAPAHGNSDGKRINAILYKEMILEAEKLFGPFYAIIAHSFGGISAALAMEQMPFPEHRKLVLIAPTTETGTAVNNFFKVITVKEAIIKDFEQYILEMTGQSFAHFSTARVIRTIPSSVLWVHDQDDKICTYSDVKDLVNEGIDRTEFLVTKGLGHNKIYLDPSVRQQIVKFITSLE